MKINCEQTVLLRKTDSGLENMLRVIVEDTAECDGEVHVNNEKAYSGKITDAEPISIWVNEPKQDSEAEISVKCGADVASERLELKKVKHLEIHMVQISHHDPGYTDIMSHVFQSHYNWIDNILDEMDKRDHYPEETRLRISIEQFWSLDYYLKNAPSEKRQKVIDRVKRGDIEITALYGNMITEQMSHEEVYRTMYEANSFAKDCGVRINSACHMDIPGISYGVCRALCDAGIEFLVCDFPDYYNWGYEKLVSFKDSEKIYGYQGPGAFYWKAPDGKQLLLWDSNDIRGCGWDEKWFEIISEDMINCNYPFDVLRVSVRSASFDNAPYTPDFADKAQAWNEKYAYPKVVISTNERFFEAFKRDAERQNVQIPVLTGDLPGQDYPVAALSMQQITATARKVQHKLVAAEKLVTLAGDDIKKQDKLLRETWKDLLISDDHAYGFQFPAGPAMRASYWEKGAYAMRAEATCDDLFDKALSSFADRICADNDNLRLVVFNPSGAGVTKGVEAPMREFDNCGTIFFPDNNNPDTLKGYILNKRRRVNPEENFWRDCRFRLVDSDNGNEIPYFVDKICWNEPEYYAPERCGLAAGGKRMGFFEVPGGMERILRFTAENIPAFGYKCYELVPTAECNGAETRTGKNEISNGIYKICTDDKGISSIVDLRTDRELTDKNCPHRFGDILVRTKCDTHTDAMTVKSVVCNENDVYSVVRIEAETDGAYEVGIKFSMYHNVDKIDVSMHILKNAKPLQTMFMAFPFAGKGFSYQGPLCELLPGKNLLPGAQSDFLTVADYVKVNESNILWCPKDTGVVALGDLWSGYVSPAHSCVMEPCIHNPLTEEELNKSGWIYSMLCANNFGTNFMCSQSFDGVYKFSFGVTDKKNTSDYAFWGESERNPLVTQFTDRSRGNLPTSASLIDAGEIQCLAFKKAEDSNGYIMRLWNHSDDEKPLDIKICGKQITNMIACDALERETGAINPAIKGNTVITIKISEL